MSEIEFIIFSLEIFSIRAKIRYDVETLRWFRSEVLMLARESNNLEDFKRKLIYFQYSKIFKFYLRYIVLLDKYYNYINGKNVYLNFQKDL